MTDAIARLTTALEGRYTIEGELGAGGMATVYLAHDVRHDRKVALKVLRPELASILGAGRFLSEIKTTANLQHPHILPLHDSGEADGLVFYVMPYVEGESLRDRLTREHQLPVDEAVQIAREVASALDYAHRHNVVHRDIKPENILLHEGQALVADFGIALAASRSDSSSRMTETGMSLGTPHYMAPEQAMGEREITAKADIYALGCVMYEMLVGEPPFTGPTAQAIVARVMTEQPRRLTLQRHTIPPNVEAAVGRALEKLPADRFGSAAEFAAALTNPAFRTATTAALSPATGRAAWLMRPAMALAAVAALATLVAIWALARPARRPVIRYGLSLPPAQAPIADRPAAVSPDGSYIVYVGPGPGSAGTQLWVKARDRYEASPLTGTTGVLNFAFSPDGQWIAFVQGGLLKKLPIIGGSAITLADSLSGVQGLAWLDDGSLVYITVGAREMRRVPDVGGPSRRVWRSDTASCSFPTGLPGGRGVLFTRCRGGGCRFEQDLWVLDLRSGAARRLITGASFGQYVPTGHVIYVRQDGGMFAVPFSLRALAMRGAPIPVLDSIAVVNGVIPLISVSADGTLLMRPGAAQSSLARYEMVWVDRAGRETLVDSAWSFRLTSFGLNSGWALSPDGSRLAIGLATDAGDDIWVKQLPRGPLSRVTFDSASEFRPRWMPDGRSVMYASNRSPSADLYQKRADGTGVEKLVLDLALGIYEGIWSRDGRWLVVRTGGTLGVVGGRDIYAIRPGVDSTPMPLVNTPAFDEAAIALSPDGRWLAYESNETGRTEIYVRTFPTVEAGKWQVSTSGGVAPLWNPRGRELLYVNGSREMVSVPIPPGLAFRPGAQRTLFRMRDELYLGDHENYTPYDIGRDGNRFVMARRVRSAASQPAPTIIVENWFEELKQRVGRR
jgi:eukaryotic-like serine/threonine-protein kinase